MPVETDYSKIGGWVDGTLVPVEKLLAHQKGIKHKAVSVFIVNDDKTLLQQRSLSKYHSPGLWANSCCTHPLWNEDPRDCAVRRLDEELGLTGLSPRYRHTLEYRAEVGDGLIEHEVVDVFVAQWTKGATLRPNPEEVASTAWISIDEVSQIVETNPERYSAWLRIYMQNHSQSIFLDQ